MVEIHKVDLSLPSFENSYRRLTPDIKQQAKEAIKKLLSCGKSPFPKSLCFEKMKGYKNPNIYAIHITPNNSHKASFEIIKNVAVFRQIGTHKELDRAP